MPKSPRPSAIPPDRAGKNSLVHRLFILTAWFSELEPVKLLPLWDYALPVQATLGDSTGLLAAGLPRPP
jgi:hypothetical protein